MSGEQTQRYMACVFHAKFDDISEESVSVTLSVPRWFPVSKCCAGLYLHLCIVAMRGFHEVRFGFGFCVADEFVVA